MNERVMENLAAEVVPHLPPKKVSVTLQLDADVLHWFMKQGNENAHINKSLRTYMEFKTKQQLKLTDIKKIKQLIASNKLKPLA